jgi:hypothetical protein
MQTLNVGAGRTDAEYKQAEEQRVAGLRADSQADANYFFWAAAVAALASGLFPVRFNIFVNVGVFDLLGRYGRPIGQFYPLVAYSTVAAWLVALVALGFAGRSGYRWAFIAGIVLYAADMIVLMLMFSFVAFGVHAFLVLKWFQGQKALKDIDEGGTSTL